MRQVRDFAAGHEDLSPAGALESLQGLSGGRIDKTMIGNRPIIVGGQGEKVQGKLPRQGFTGRCVLVTIRKTTAL